MDEDGAPPARAGANARLGRNEDLKTLRLRRQAARAAGGTLDLVMMMRAGTDGPPLFCAPPMVGLCWMYMALVPHVDPRYPLYGLQARGLRRPEPLPSSMPEMVRDYADQIRLTQPAGPYQLLGMSLGGNFAFAVAEELQRRGEEIGLLVILDQILTSLEGIEEEPWAIYNLVLAQFGYVPVVRPGEPDPESRMLEAVRRQPGLGLDEWPDERLRAMQRVIKNNIAVAHSYQPGRVRCPLLFFSAARNGPPLSWKLECWEPFIDGPIEGIELDCDHRQMLLPESMARLAPALSDRMARVVTATRSPIV